MDSLPLPLLINFLMDSIKGEEHIEILKMINSFSQTCKKWFSKKN